MRSSRPLLWTAFVASTAIFCLTVWRWLSSGMHWDDNLFSCVWGGVVSASLLWVSIKSKAMALGLELSAHLHECHRCWRAGSMLRSGWPREKAFDQMCETGKLRVIAYDEEQGVIGREQAADLRRQCSSDASNDHPRQGKSQ